MRLFTAWAALLLFVAPPQEKPTGQGFSFRSNVALINVTATVTDGNGHFVTGLSKDDFEIYEDGVLQTTSHFDAERVPVSLGMAIDTSGSMIGEKWAAAQAAVQRFLGELLGEQDEVFLYRFDSRAQLVQPWTSDRRAAGCSRKAAPRCMTRSPRPCLSRSKARNARRRSSSSPTARTPAARSRCPN
jgi:VWFA-related protein